MRHARCQSCSSFGCVVKTLFRCRVRAQILGVWFLMDLSVRSFLLETWTGFGFPQLSNAISMEVPMNSWSSEAVFRSSNAFLRSGLGHARVCRFRLKYSAAAVHVSAFFTIRLETVKDMLCTLPLPASLAC